MRIQLTGGTSLLLGTLLATTASAQSTINPKAVTAPVKDAGTYHVASGTWTRANAQSAIGAEVIYNNTGAIAYFTTMSDNAVTQFEITDAGRIPSTSDVGTDDTYTVDGFFFAYCSSSGLGSAALTANYDFYEGGIAPCQRPAGSPVGSLTISGLPTSGTVGVQGCWLITVDLDNSTDDFAIRGDGEGLFDGSLALDVFSYTVDFTGHNDNTTGPILFGDPVASPFGDGTTVNTAAGPGPDGTGLSQSDFFWIETPLLLGPGCYFFGGYPTGAPWAGFYMQLLGDLGDTTGGSQGTTYCATSPNSLGAGAVLTGISGFGTAAASFDLSGVPTQPGIPFAGNTQITFPFGCGVLCIGGTITRGNVIVPMMNNGNVVNYNMGLANTLNIAYWYRDPANFGACGDTFNLSNALN